MATVPVVPGTLGGTVKMLDSMEKCTIDGCSERRYMHNGNEGDGDCAKVGCPCMAGRYPSDEVKRE